MESLMLVMMLCGGASVGASVVTGAVIAVVSALKLVGWACERSYYKAQRREIARNMGIEDIVYGKRRG